MANLRIQFMAVGARNYRALLVGAAVVLREADVYSKRFMEKLVERTRVYPPVPEGSRYIRTNTLMESWKVIPFAAARGGIGYRVENRAVDPGGRRYATLVHGPTGQWGTHASHGWRNIGEELERMGGRRKFASDLQRIITRGLVT